jgi:hypothetical protein
VQQFQHGEQALDVAGDQRMVSRIELCGTHARREATEQLFVLSDFGMDIGRQIELPSILANSVRATVRTPRGPRVDAARSASSAGGEPILASAAAAAARWRRVRNGAHQTPW